MIYAIFHPKRKERKKDQNGFGQGSERAINKLPSSELEFYFECQGLSLSLQTKICVYKPPPAYYEEGTWPQGWLSRFLTAGSDERAPLCNPTQGLFVAFLISLIKLLLELELRITLPNT